MPEAFAALSAVPGKADAAPRVVIEGRQVRQPRQRGQVCETR